MTRRLEDTLNLPHLDDLLKETGDMPDAPEPDAPAEPADNGASPHDMLNALQVAKNANAMMDGRDHAEAMDKLYVETLRHAQNIVDLGFNVDQARAPRVFEVAAQFYKAAMDAKNSKRDAQLKAMQLMLNQQKLELDKKVAGKDPSTIEVDAVVVEDRNELLKRLRDQARAEKDK